MTPVTGLKLYSGEMTSLERSKILTKALVATAIKWLDWGAQRARQIKWADERLRFREGCVRSEKWKDGEEKSNVREILISTIFCADFPFTLPHPELLYSAHKLYQATVSKFNFA